MTPFEYVTVLISIVLGLGITQIVTGIADLIQQWDRVKVYWVHVLWIVIVFFLMVQEWWSTYELRQFESLRLPTFFFVLLYPIDLFILARIIFPAVQPDGEVDLQRFYYANYRRFFLWASPLPALSLLNNVLVTGHSFETQVGHALLLAVLLFLVTRKNLGEWAHKVFAVVLVSLMVISLAVMWNDALTNP
jgi:hypothetical protein